MDRFDEVVPSWLGLGYIYDATTLHVRQSEATFSEWVGADLLASVAARMGGQEPGDDVHRALREVESGARRAPFEIGDLEGTVERQQGRCIYIAVWERRTHRR